MNVDGSLKSHNATGGGIIRNHEGNFIAESTRELKRKQA